MTEWAPASPTAADPATGKKLRATVTVEFTAEELAAVSELANTRGYTVATYLHVKALEEAGTGASGYPRGLLEVMTPEQAEIWWDSPQSRWAGATPRVMSQTLSHDEVMAAATAVVNGDYS